MVHGMQPALMITFRGLGEKWFQNKVKQTLIPVVCCRHCGQSQEWELWSV